MKIGNFLKEQKALSEFSTTILACQNCSVTYKINYKIKCRDYIPWQRQRNKLIFVQII